MLQHLRGCVYLLITIAAAGYAAILTNLTCTNPLNQRGICISLKDCTYLLKLVADINLTEENRTLLQKSQCGIDPNGADMSGKVLVCCPDSFRNVTSEGGSVAGTKPGNVLPEPGECGKSLANRIYGGNLTEIDEFPWMALIQYKTGPERYGFYCGGSLINSRYVLTAGHCIRHPDMPASWELHKVRLGEWDINTDPDCITDTRGREECSEPHMDVLIDYALYHSQYIPSSKEQFNDIALIRLATPVAITSTIIPICLPVAQDIRAKMYTGTATDVAGWGVTESGTSSSVKLKITVNVWNITKCQSTYSRFQLPISGDHQMCAGGEHGIDTCRGDSGGPLMARERIDKHDVYFVIGVVSYGPKPCALEGWPGVYTRMGYHMDWLLNNLLP